MSWKEFNNALKKVSCENEIENKVIEKVKNYLDYKIGSFWDGWTIDCKKESNDQVCADQSSFKMWIHLFSPVANFANAIKIPITIMKPINGKPKKQITAMMQMMPASVLMVIPSCIDRTH